MGCLPCGELLLRQSNKKQQHQNQENLPKPKFTFKCCSCKILKANTEVLVGTRRLPVFRQPACLKPAMQASLRPSKCWEKHTQVCYKVFFQQHKMDSGHVHISSKMLQKKLCYNFYEMLLRSHRSSQLSEGFSHVKPLRKGCGAQSQLLDLPV